MNSQLAEAHTKIADAKRLNESGQHGVALKRAYEASELVAAAYLTPVTNRMLPPNDENFDLFAKTICELNRNPILSEKIRETVGKVCALREAYEPALLDETSLQDAQQMIERVEALLELVQNG